VRTFIQSGNVIFTAGSRVSTRLAEVIASKISERFGYRVPVILRTAKEIREVVSKNPFPLMEEVLHVMFLANRPGSKEVAALDANRSTRDAFTVLGQEIYLHLPNGAGDTKLTNAWFDSKLATTSTMRNWRTVTKLLALMEE
jgi:uncharacterized protein (DUF1697 family)